MVLSFEHFCQLLLQKNTKNLPFHPSGEAVRHGHRSGAEVADSELVQKGGFRDALLQLTG